VTDVRYCIKCKKAYDIGIEKELCPECRELNGVKKDDIRN